MVVEFECRKCGKVVSLKEYEQDKFCPNCETRLRLKTRKIDLVDKTKRKHIKINISDSDLDSLFYEFTNYKPIDVGGGVVFPSVDTWVSARKQAYKRFRKQFSGERLLNFDFLSIVFKDWLLFRNNLSWTTLHRSGYKALEEPNRLAELIILLRDDELDVEERIQRGLMGKEKVKGIGPAILTGLLHTFFDDKYGVWNSRTQETLNILHFPLPKSYSNIGKSYKAVNTTLNELAQQLDTDLTTIDGFMWFVSKEGIFR